MTTGNTTRGGGEGPSSAAQSALPRALLTSPHPGPGDTGVTVRQDMPSQVEGTKGIFRLRQAGRGPAGRRGEWEEAWGCERLPVAPERGPPAPPPWSQGGRLGPLSSLNGAGPPRPPARCPPSPACPLHSGFECITYPLLGPTSGSPEPRAAPDSADTDSPPPKGDREVAPASDTLCGQGDAASDLPGEWP